MQFTLRMIREASGYTVEEVAEYCGMDVNKVEGIENGTEEARASTIIILREIYKIPIDYMIM